MDKWKNCIGEKNLENIIFLCKNFKRNWNILYVLWINLVKLLKIIRVFLIDWLFFWL